MRIYLGGFAIKFRDLSISMQIDFKMDLENTLFGKKQDFSVCVAQS